MKKFFRIVRRNQRYEVDENLLFFFWRKVKYAGGQVMSFMELREAQDWCSKTLLEEQSKQKDRVIEYWEEEDV